MESNGCTTKRNLMRVSIKYDQWGTFKAEKWLNLFTIYKVGLESTVVKDVYFVTSKEKFMLGVIQHGIQFQELLW